MKALAFAQTIISLRSLHRFTGSQKSRLIEAGGTSGCPPTLSRAQLQSQVTLELSLKPPSTSRSLHRAQHLPGTAVLPGEPPGHAQGLLSWHHRAHPVLPHLHQVVVGTGESPQASPSPDRAAPAPPGPPAQRWPRAGLSPACPGLSCWEARCTSIYPVYLILNNSSWHFKIQIVTDFSANFIPK